MLSSLGSRLIVVVRQAGRVVVKVCDYLDN